MKKKCVAYLQEDFLFTPNQPIKTNIIPINIPQIRKGAKHSFVSADHKTFGKVLCPSKSTLQTASRTVFHENNNVIST
jgi:hypothetical protein